MYGGTKGEMERLIRDANRLKEANGEMADLSVSSFANIVEAIHLVQVEMGISGISAEEAAEKVASGAMTQEAAFEAMGTTAKEASSTIQGSVSSMSAAWSNLVTGIANDEADFGSLVSNFAGSVSTAADNIVPRIRIAVEGVSLLVDELLPTIADKVPQIISENLPTIVESGAKIVTSLVNGISDNKDDLIKPATDAMTKIGTTMIDLLPDVLSIGGDVITSLASGVSDALPDLIPAAESAISKIVEELGDTESVEELAGAALDIITQLAAGLSDSLPELIPAAFDAILTIAEKLTSYESVLELSGAALDVIIALAAGLVEALPDLTERVPEIVNGLVDALTSEENLEKMRDAGVALLAAVLQGATSIERLIWGETAGETANRWALEGEIRDIEEFIAKDKPIPAARLQHLEFLGANADKIVADAYVAQNKSIPSDVLERLGYDVNAMQSELERDFLDISAPAKVQHSMFNNPGNTVIINAPSIDQSTVDYLVRQVNSQLGVEAW